MLQALKLDLKCIHLFQKVFWIYLGNTIIFDIYLMEMFEYSKTYSMKNIWIIEYIQRGQNVSNEYLNIFTNLKWSNIFGTKYIRDKNIQIKALNWGCSYYYYSYYYYSVTNFASDCDWLVDVMWLHSKHIIGP